MKSFSNKPFFKVLLIFLGFILGTIFSNLRYKKDYIFKEIRKESTFNFISPLLECDSSISENKQSINLKKNLQTIVDENTQKGNIEIASIYYRDLNNGPWIGINEKEKFIPASLIKIPTMIAYFKEAEENPQILSQKITYQQNIDFIQQQNYPPEQSIQKDQEYSIEELIEKMIVYSDNASYKLLLANINKKIFLQTFKDLGINNNLSLNQNDENFITVKDYASFFRVLYNASYLNEYLSEKALYLLSQSTFKDGLVKPLPSNIIISHKFGERAFFDYNQKQLHDCGIIYKNSNPYLLCVMTKGKNFEKLTKIIQDISLTVYNSQ